MPYLILSDASLAFGHVPLLDHAEFQLDPGERVALIGRNGTGKSSLLCALAGTGGLDDGTVWRQPGLRIGYVPQEPPFDPALSVFEAVVAGMGDLSKLLAEYHAVSHALGEADADHEKLLDRMQLLQTELEARDAWSFEAQAERVIQRFSLDADALVGTLSGGQKKRLALAQALAVSPELLLLDEPTNHLDIGAIEWLEEMLVSSGVTLAFITHDRRFLERVATLQWGLVLCVFCISHVPALLSLDIAGYEGRNLLLIVFLVLVVQSSDVLQYVWGKLIGRTKVAPNLSPSKTWEGFIGGTLSATLIGTSLWWMTPFSLTEAAGMCLVITLMGFFGGLVMSAIKRDKGVKDWGHLIAGHGGFIDRLDSVIFAAPIFFHFTRFWWSAV